MRQDTLVMIVQVMMAIAIISVAAVFIGMFFAVAHGNPWGQGQQDALFLELEAARIARQ